MLENLESFVLNKYNFNGDAIGVNSLGSAFMAISKYINELKVTGLAENVKYALPDSSPVALMNAITNHSEDIVVYNNVSQEEFHDKVQAVYISQKDILGLKPNIQEDDIFYIGNADYTDVNPEAIKYYDNFCIEYKHGTVILATDIEQALRIRAIISNGILSNNGVDEKYYTGYDTIMNNVSAAAILDELQYKKPTMIKSYAKFAAILEEEKA